MNCFAGLFFRACHPRVFFRTCHPRESEDPDLNNVLNLIYELDPRFREDDRLNKRG